MTAIIYRSTLEQLGFDFDAAIKAHIEALEKHRYTTNEPAPQAHPWVETAVRRVQRPGEADEFVSDYVVQDDHIAPPPKPSLSDRKKMLFDRILQAEQVALQRICPFGKRRLYAQMAIDIANKQRKTKDDKQFLAEE